MRVDQRVIRRFLDWAYDKAVEGFPGVGTVEEMAEGYLKGGGPIHDRVDALIRWQVTKAATSGFVSGLGGIMTLPVAIPADITHVSYIHLRLIAAIAHMGGHDIRDDRVKALCLACLCGNAALDVMKGAGVKAGTRLADEGAKRLAAEVAKQINQAVGSRLAANIGGKGVIYFTKAVPVLGGVVGGTIDALATITIGHVAKRIFIGDRRPSFSFDERSGPIPLPMSFPDPVALPTATQGEE